MSTYQNLYETKMKEIQDRFKNRNVYTDLYLYQLFRAVIIHSFKWENIPSFIKQHPDYIEESLSGYGRIAFFMKDGEPYIAPATPNGMLKKSGLYTSYTMVFRNGETVILPIDEIELCDNNFDCMPSDILLNTMVEKCSNALKAVDRALDKMSMNDLIVCKDETTMTKVAEALSSSYNKDVPINVTMGDWTSDDITLKVLADNRNIAIKDLYDVFIRYRNLYLTTFGINTVEISKPERLTMAEGSSNDEIVQYTLFGDMYEHRKDFCERVKNHFGYDLRVVPNRGIDTTVNLELNVEEKLEMKNKIIAPYADESKSGIVDKNVIKQGDTENGNKNNQE